MSLISLMPVAASSSIFFRDSPRQRHKCLLGHIPGAVLPELAWVQGITSPVGKGIGRIISAQHIPHFSQPQGNLFLDGVILNLETPLFYPGSRLFS